MVSLVDGQEPRVDVFAVAGRVGARRERGQGRDLCPGQPTPRSGERAAATPVPAATVPSSDDHVTMNMNRFDQVGVPGERLHAL